MAYAPIQHTTTRLVFCLFILTTLLTACQPAPADQAAPVTLTVSAASDLTAAFQEIATLFEAETGQRVVFNFGSTGQLAQQIEQGAPVDLFAAANVRFIDELAAQNLVLRDTVQTYARGRITLWTRADSPLEITQLTDLLRPDVQRIAIANPDHAPYGVAAREAMQAAGVWDAVQPKLILGENVRQALQYAETGNVDAAIVAHSLSVPAAAGPDGPGRWTLIPAEMHTPLDQALAVIQGTPHEAAARAFAAFVIGPQGQSIMHKYGFVLPGEEPVP